MNLLTQSFWRDEAFTGLLIRHNPIEIIRLIMHDSTPPLYYLVLWLWSQVFGQSEVGLRLLSVGFWLGAAAVMWGIAKELRVSKVWVAVLLLLTQPLVVIYAFEARAYEQLLFLTAVSLYLFLVKKRLENDNEKVLWVNVLLVVSLTAALYTHLFGAWTVLVLIGWAIVEKLRWGWLIIPLVLFLPWVPVILNFSNNGGALPYILDWQKLGVTMLVVGTPFLFAVLFYLTKLWKNRNFIGLSALWVVPIVGAVLYTKLKQQFLFQPRYLIETAVPLGVLISLITKQKAGLIIASLIVMLQLAISGFIFNQQKLPSVELATQLNSMINNTHKSPYRDLAQYIKENQQSGDIVVNATPLTYLEAHYYQLPAVIYNPYHNAIPEYLGLVLINRKDELATLPKGRRYFVISSREGGGESRYVFLRNRIWSRDYGTLNLSLYDKD